MIELVIPARRKDLGGGFEVGRVLPFAKQRMVGPFIFLDHMGPADFAAGRASMCGRIRISDWRPSPIFSKARFFTKTIWDTKQSIRPGEVNWMTAGQGVVHSERTDAGVARETIARAWFAGLGGAAR